MLSLKFCANLSWLFTELQGFPQRMYAAAASGFQAVEAGWLYDSDINELKEARQRTALQVVLINTPPGNIKAGELGLGAVPGRQAEFREGLERAVMVAKALDCTRIHLMAGRVPVGMDRTSVATEMEATFVDNLKFAADVLSKEGILGLIEPINTRITDPRYFLDTPHRAAAILQKVNHSNIKLQMTPHFESYGQCRGGSVRNWVAGLNQDIFHWQIMDGNLTQNIQKYFPIIGHVQIAQVPGRNEPDSPGELNFAYLFELLESLGYKDYIGCEYKPSNCTEAGLGWLKEYWRNHKTQDLAAPPCLSDP